MSDDKQLGESIRAYLDLEYIKVGLAAIMYQAKRMMEEESCKGEPYMGYLLLHARAFELADGVCFDGEYVKSTLSAQEAEDCPTVEVLIDCLVEHAEECIGNACIKGEKEAWQYVRSVLKNMQSIVNEYITKG